MSFSSSSLLTPTVESPSLHFVLSEAGLSSLSMILTSEVKFRGGQQLRSSLSRFSSSSSSYIASSFSAWNERLRRSLSRFSLYSFFILCFLLICMSEISMSMKQTVVLYPIPGMGHLMPMMEFAKLCLLHDFAVAVVLMHSPKKHPSVDPFVQRISAAYPSISFHQLPPPASIDPAVHFLQLTELNNPELLQFLAAHRQTSDIRAVVLDFFCTDALRVTAELGLRSCIFFSSGAADLAALLYVPFHQSTTEQSFADLGETPLHFPGLPPLPASHLPRELSPREGLMYKSMIKVCESMPHADSILINSFELLEADALPALRDGSCVPGRQMPPVYCIGPLIADGNRDVGRGKEEKAECVAWLDEQPRGSVVFLCFGSMGTFSAAQLKQMAIGLEKSGHRFLWVVRAPPTENDPRHALPPPVDPDLEALLPEGFLERTKQRGLVVKSWAPQVEVLNHEAVGGFVSHCGWNSTLEAITAGVAIVAWPLYAEQRMNKVFLVEQMRMAVAMDGYDREMVEAEEVERKIRWLMESEEGRKLRERAAEMKESAAEARREGGSSHKAWLEAVKMLMK